MKKLIILALIFTSSSLLRAQQNLSSNDRQKTHKNDSTESNEISFYSGVGISLGNQDSTTFIETNYFSIENGFMFHDFYGGIVLGNGNLNFERDKYFYEIKTGYSFPIGILNGNTFFGFGRYFKEQEGQKTQFIEYGAGFSYTYKKVSFGVCYSNWAGYDYITPSITFNW